MSVLETQIKNELDDIVRILEEMIGLKSRWSGQVELIHEADFKGKKRFICDIQINAALAQQDIRWSTLIHEALHCLSAGYYGVDYRIYPGWEEGAVQPSTFISPTSTCSFRYLDTS